MISGSVGPLEITFYATPDMIEAVARNTSRERRLADTDALPWVIEQLRHASEGCPEITERHDILLAAILEMGHDFEAVFPQTNCQRPGSDTTSRYFHSFVNEMVGNLFVQSTWSFEEGLQKITLARQAARIYLDGERNPSAFIGYPVLKILVRHSVTDAETWISCLKCRGELVRLIKENVLDVMVDDADSPQALAALMDTSMPKAALDLSALHIPTGLQRG